MTELQDSSCILRVELGRSILTKYGALLFINYLYLAGGDMTYEGRAYQEPCKC